MTGYNPNKKSLVADDPRKLAHDLNCFYARFDSTDLSAERAAILVLANGREQREEVLTEEEVSGRFRLVSQRSACGPDEIPGAVLKYCHDSLVSVFTTLFQGLWNRVTFPPSFLFRSSEDNGNNPKSISALIA